MCSATFSECKFPPGGRAPRIHRHKWVSKPGRVPSWSPERDLYWDRSRACPAVGGGFPLLLFRLQDGFAPPAAYGTASKAHDAHRARAGHRGSAQRTRHQYPARQRQVASRHREPIAGADAGLTTAALPPIRTIGIAFVFRTEIVGTRRDGAQDDAEQKCQSDKTTHGTNLVSNDEVTGSVCAVRGRPKYEPLHSGSFHSPGGP
jgi:hypothetical protein